MSNSYISIKNNIKLIYGLLNLLKYKFVRSIDIEKLLLVINFLGYKLENPMYQQIIDSFFHFYYKTQLAPDEISIEIKKGNNSPSFLRNSFNIITAIKKQIETAIKIQEQKVGVLV